MLNDHAELCHEAAQLMQDVFEGEVEKQEALREIEQKEHEADELVAATMDRLRKTFITPMDREDIQLLIDQLDNTIDNIKEIIDIRNVSNLIGIAKPYCPYDMSKNGHKAPHTMCFHIGPRNNEIEACNSCDTSNTS